MNNKVVTKTSTEFGSVRCVEEKGSVVYCASDVAKALGYSNSRKASSALIYLMGYIARDIAVIDELRRRTLLSSTVEEVNENKKQLAVAIRRLKELCFDVETIRTC